jgi:hypothetical protein
VLPSSPLVRLLLLHPTLTNTQGATNSTSALASTPQPIHLQYTSHVTSATCEGHNCALVYNGGLVMVFRADTIGEHYLWIRALRSRLMPESTVDIVSGVLES